jgi:hypothetical protein
MGPGDSSQLGGAPRPDAVAAGAGSEAEAESLEEMQEAGGDDTEPVSPDPVDVPFTAVTVAPFEQPAPSVPVPFEEPIVPTPVEQQVAPEPVAPPEVPAVRPEEQAPEPAGPPVDPERNDY